VIGSSSDERHSPPARGPAVRGSPSIPILPHLRKPCFVLLTARTRHSRAAPTAAEEFPVFSQLIRLFTLGPGRLGALLAAPPHLPGVTRQPARPSLAEPDAFLRRGLWNRPSSILWLSEFGGSRTGESGVDLRWRQALLARLGVRAKQLRSDCCPTAASASSDAIQVASSTSRPAAGDCPLHSSFSADRLRAKLIMRSGYAVGMDVAMEQIIGNEGWTTVK
jgi:hypothetical protein